MSIGSNLMVEIKSYLLVKHMTFFSTKIQPRASSLFLSSVTRS